MEYNKYNIPRHFEHIEKTHKPSFGSALPKKVFNTITKRNSLEDYCDSGVEVKHPSFSTGYGHFQPTYTLRDNAPGKYFSR